ncbi:hypothetical protein ACF0H5_018324 [Mactra antiquata]
MYSMDSYSTSVYTSTYVFLLNVFIICKRLTAQSSFPGLGRTTETISELTESVLDTIKKDSVSVNGVEAKDSNLDSAYIQLSCINENSDTVGLESVDQVIQIVDKTGEYQPLTCPDVKTQHCCKCAKCTAIRGLKRKNLELEIAILVKRQKAAEQ